VANFTEKLINNMKVGKLYKSLLNGVVVKCTKLTTDRNYFCGFVVKPCYDNIMTEGFTSDGWYCNSFEEYEQDSTSNQVGGNHYKDCKIQPTEFIHANNIPFIEGNIIKYVIRHRNKNGIEDLKKAKHYIDLLIQFEYETTKVI
jgi:hypothetical protein